MASHGFLSPKAYDRDAEDVDSTFDYDAEKLRDAKSSSETARRHSEGILQEEEETERLIAGHYTSGRTAKISGSKFISENTHLSEEALQQRTMSGIRETEDEEGELLWRMRGSEENEKESGSRSSGSWRSGSYDDDQMREEKDLSQAAYKSSRSWLAKFTLIRAVIVGFLLLFLGLLFGAYRYKLAPGPSGSKTASATLMSNGTSFFAPDHPTLN